MTDGRKFEWPDKAASDLQGVLNDALNQVYRGHEQSSYILAEEVLSLLKPFVKEALAEAWDQGFEVGKDFGAYLEGGYGYYPLEPNPYA